jgi:hypothetical protein
MFKCAIVSVIVNKRVKMKYQRKTRSKFLSDAFIGLGLLSGVLIGAGWNRMIVGEVWSYDTDTVITKVDRIVYTQPDAPEDIIMTVFGEDGELAVKVAKCESGLNPNAINKTSSARGLFQIMQSWHKIDQKWLFDPMINTLVARQLFDESGGSFSPHWDASIDCWSK